MKISVLTPTIRPEEGLKRVAKSLRKQSFKNFEWLVEINITDKPDFNQAMNKMLKRAKGELIVILQDYIEIPENGLENFWNAYQKNPRILYTSAVVKIKKNKEKQYDWRFYDMGIEYKNFMEWEIDWACAPKKMFFEVGGFDEYLDQAWSFDNVNIGLRAVMYGYKIKVLPGNTAYAIDHDEIIKHPFRKLRDCKLHNDRLEEIRQGLIIEYL